MTKSIRTDTIVINKILELTNVQILNSHLSDEGYFNLIRFTNKVTLNNQISAHFLECSFEKPVYIQLKIDRNFISPSDLQLFSIPELDIMDSQFKSGLHIGQSINDHEENRNIGLSGNKFSNSNLKTEYNTSFSIGLKKNARLYFQNNEFKEKVESKFVLGQSDLSVIKNNIFTESTLIYTDDEIQVLQLEDNKFSKYVFFQLPELRPRYSIKWPDLSGKLIQYWAFTYKLLELQVDQKSQFKPRNTNPTDENISYYLDSIKIQDESVFREESKLRGLLYEHYKSQHDIVYASSVYVELKDLETQRLAYIYRTDPSFDNFFQWKVNQFLKIFSNYGTKPSKAIIFSVRVIVFFALIYLFFPNYWDSHGKDRILHRYSFFFKYLNQEAGLHDVYLEGKRDELTHYEGFKNFFEENGKTVPKFFLATALPLYRWSIASTKTSSWFLSKVDIFRGRWSELPPAQKAAKTMLLSLTFTIALLYDIFIKMLNALMLSINTFTTLGFGEIPIKGLPRYLAIIQGFIGWFMLTIFSVSLISQLLN